MVELITAGVLVGPFFNGVEHLLMDFGPSIAQGRVVERLEDVVADLLDRDRGILPGKQDAWNGVLQNRDSYTSSARVEDVGEMILCKHTVSGIRTARVIPRLMLGARTGGDNTR